MNELNQLETRLRSWTPRLPSAAIKARIFANEAGRDVPIALPPRNSMPAWQWLAPSMAVFVIAMMSWNDGAHPSFISSTESLGASAWRDPQLAAYSSAQIENNVWPVATFHWTNERQNLSTAAPVLVTNSTIP
jgi:sugar/nucleoside kinase (ribokinase family)